ncbi:hypothetical protein HanPI659440_Chr04g0163291 [Helianthus annuus]|uniref:DUF506 family protein n=1 Tax=Helianthus annuus TaxID=4232 RepID=A0A251UXR0_HELAN|nr:uncharacterized protein LOC110936503 [Helianthus annuus]KAF5810328.1 hypothetical protein HanXRQr2_Chr04g0168111 [Helianthus annuus]KAJ0589022.1 hypothetical protein HanIR_Chr04g0181371 [Helianthus annuus]KAJ0796535.1 hypothetical protein HanPI659440_Chr04g0163291 [Helianthus annuus]KAJ0931450.1 hypothetical protein HanPSC8_Chr04g0161771 [Helianthus annuus]
MAVRVKRVTDPLDDRVKNRIVAAYHSSGSEHSGTASHISDDDDDSSHSVHSLSYLLRCFDEENDDDDAINTDEQDVKPRAHESDSDFSDSDSDQGEEKLEEINSTMRNLNVDRFRNVLFSNVLEAMAVFRCLKPNTQILNRNVMMFLQKLGYNAAICKTKWRSCGGLTAGNYEFIDVVQSGSGVRYFIDVNFAGEFQIARQTNQFRRFLQNLPVVFVGKSADLKVIVKLMSDEIRRSMKCRGLLLPPWRKNRFMQNKWFGPYRRTVNYIPANIASCLTVPVNQMTANVKCSMIGFSVVDSAPLLNAATRTR